MQLSTHDITKAILTQLESEYDMNDTRIFTEFQLGHTRVDILVVTGNHLICYEIKGEKDSINERWKRQHQWYSHFTGNVILVYAQPLRNEYFKALKQGYGGGGYVDIEVRVENDELAFYQFDRPCSKIAPKYYFGNGDLCPRWRLASLWKDELKHICKKHGLGVKLSKLNKSHLMEAIYTKLTAPVIHQEFVLALKTRHYDSLRIGDRGYISPTLSKE